MVREMKETRRQPPRPIAVMIRLSLEEMTRLDAYARREDRRIGPSARHLLISALDPDTPKTRDGHAT